jgi:hypothetical protein
MWKGGIEPDNVNAVLKMRFLDLGQLIDLRLQFWKQFWCFVVVMSHPQSLKAMQLVRRLEIGYVSLGLLAYYQKEKRVWG